jgi:hypothetical protein
MKFDLFDKQTKGKIEVEADESGNAWMAICPKHSDTNPSLCIDPEKGLYNCFGCGFKGQLWDQTKRGINSQPDDPPDDSSEPDDLDLLLTNPTATYDYCNAHGGLLYQLLKYPAPPPKNKTFRQRRPNSKGGWIWDLEGMPKVLYRLRELNEGEDPVFIVEGEKDVESLRALGLTATTNPMGAGKWSSVYDRYLGGRNVIILPDNDDVGKNHAKQVSRSLKGIAKSVRVVELPYLSVGGEYVPMPEHGDVSDLLESLKEDITKEDFLTLINLEELERKDEPETDDYHFISGNELLAMPKPKVEWVLDGILGAGHLGFVLGKPKAGKTYFTFNLGVCVSRGTPFLGRQVTQGPVLYLALDRDEIGKYMEMMGGDFSNIFFHYDIAPSDPVGKLIKKIEERSPRLVIADMMQKLLRFKEDPGYAESVLALEPLSDVAHRFRCVFLLNHHSPKEERQVVDSALGTTGYIASSDTSILIKKDQNERRSFYTLQRYHNPGEKDIKGEVIDLMADGITLISGGTILDANTREVKEQILKVLANVPEGDTMTTSEIVSAAHRDRNFVIKCLSQLEQEFKIRKSGHGTRSSPHKFSSRQERNISK